jgi:hypothetical protein
MVRVVAGPTRGLMPSCSTVSSHLSTDQVNSGGRGARLADDTTGNVANDHYWQPQQLVAAAAKQPF